jgi:hypothetical protein
MSGFANGDNVPLQVDAIGAAPGVRIVAISQVHHL